MAPPSGNVSRPGRALAVLAALIVVLFLAIVGSNIGSPGQWGKDFKVHLGLDLTSGTTVALKARRPRACPAPQFAADMTQAKNIMANRVNGAGFTEAQVQQQGSDIINVAVPGAGSQKVVSLVGHDRPAAVPPGDPAGAEHGRHHGHHDAHADPVGQRCRRRPGQRVTDGVRVGQLVRQDRGPGPRGGQRNRGEGDGEPVSSP